MASQDSLSLYLLGSPRLERMGQALRMGRRKALALLAYLAVSGETQRREKLVTLLWPESERALAFSYLRRELALLRKTLGSGLLDAGRESVQLVAGDKFHLDVAQFRGLLASTLEHGHQSEEACPRCLLVLAQAVDLYRDDFLAGFTLPDSPAYDDWQFFERDSLRRQLEEALTLLAHGHIQRGELETAIGFVRRWLGIDPWREPAHRLLMQLYSWTGNRAAALRQYQECARLLSEELAQEPEAETRELHEAIKSGRHLLPPSRIAVSPGAEWGLEKRGAQAVVYKPGPQTNLPEDPTPFVGRETELASLTRLLRHQADCRMLTLVGPGGIGKSRLALMAARQVMDGFPNGVFLVSLASVDSQELLMPTLADAMGLHFHGQASIKSQLFNYLREKQVLLVLDNFEHLLPAAEALSDLLTFAPGVKLLVTSRERLNLQWEWLQEVEGLTYPGAEGEDSLPWQASEGAPFSAISLFVQSARRSQAGFSPSVEDRQAIARICRLVEGTPLGIELASAWVRVMPCAEIAREISSDLDFLTTPLRDLPRRHRSLRALFEHSWKLLSEEERKVVRRLSIFQGDFERTAAEQVTGASLAVLAGLVDKSMLRAHPSGRFDMHGLLRQYASDKLQADPQESRRTRDKHSAYYARSLQVLEPDLKGAQQAQALAAIAANIDNIRLAWRWALAANGTDRVAASLEALHLFYFSRSWYQQGEDAFREAVAAIEAARGSENGGHILLLARLLARQGRFTYRLGRDREAKELLDRSLALFKKMRDQGYQVDGRDQAFSLYQLSEMARGDGDYELAADQCQQSLEMYQESRDLYGMARALNHLGILAALKGAYASAQDLLQQALKRYRATGDQYGIANTLNDLGIVADRSGQHDEAQQLYQECLAIRRKIGHLAGVGASLNNLGYFAYLRGEYGEARELLQESLAIQREIGDRYEIANCLSNLGATLRAHGDHAGALGHYREAWEIGMQIGHVPLLLEVLGGYATLLKSGSPGQRARAAEIFTFVLHHPASDQPTQEAAQQGLAELAEGIDPAALERAEQQGRAGELHTVAGDLQA